MQSLRIGSIVTLSYQTPNGSGGYSLTYETGRVVTNLTDAYLEYEGEDGSGKTALPWSTTIKVSITSP